MKASCLFLGLLVVSVPVAVMACSADVTGGDGAPAPTTSNSTDPTPKPTPTASSTAGKDAGSDTRAAAPVLRVAFAKFTNTMAGAASFAYAISFELTNDSPYEVASLDTMSFDFGGGKVVALTEPACQGNLPIAAGKARKIDVRIIAASTGAVQPANFSMMCPNSQSFGGAEGEGPPTATFAGTIAISLGGQTSGGAFAASGVAARSN